MTDFRREIQKEKTSHQGWAVRPATVVSAQPAFLWRNRIQKHRMVMHDGLHDPQCEACNEMVRMAVEDGCEVIN